MYTHVCIYMYVYKYIHISFKEPQNLHISWNEPYILSEDPDSTPGRRQAYP